MTVHAACTLLAGAHQPAQGPAASRQGWALLLAALLAALVHALVHAPELVFEDRHTVGAIRSSAAGRFASEQKSD